MKEIILTNSTLVALVDDIDFEPINQYSWRLTQNGKQNYAARGEKTLYMHHMVLGKSESLLVDHINRNGLDNRKENLRFVTKSENLMNSGLRPNNTSGCKGVSRYSDTRWRAYIIVERKQKHLGLFKTFEEAKTAYEQAMQIHYPNIKP